MSSSYYLLTLEDLQNKMIEFGLISTQLIRGVELLKDGKTYTFQQYGLTNDRNFYSILLSEDGETIEVSEEDIKKYKNLGQKLKISDIKTRIFNTTKNYNYSIFELIKESRKDSNNKENLFLYFQDLPERRQRDVFDTVYSVYMSSTGET